MQCFQYALGDIASVSSLLPVQYPEVDLIDSGTGKITEANAAKSAPDLVYMHGRLASSAVFSLTLRGGHPINGQNLLWTISGEKGDIQISSPATPIWCGFGPLKVRVKTIDEPEREVPLLEDGLESYGPPAGNIARLYEKFAKGQTDGVMDIEQALKMHQLVGKVFESSDSGSTVSL
jgi:predicted dehydrogenase